MFSALNHYIDVLSTLPLPLVGLTACGLACVFPLTLLLSVESLIGMGILLSPFDSYKIGPFAASNVVFLIAIAKALVRSRSSTSALFPLAAFGLMSVSATLFAAYPSISLKMTISLLGEIGLFYAVTTLSREAAIERLLHFVIGGGLLASCFAAVQFGAYEFLGVSLWQLGGLEVPLFHIANVVRLSSILPSSESLASFMVFPLAAVGFYRENTPPGSRHRWLTFLFWLFLAVSIGSGSRSAYVTCGILLVVIYGGRLRRRIKRLYPLFIAFAIVLAFTLALPTASAVANWNGESTYTRLCLIKGALATFAQRPLQGWGWQYTFQPEIINNTWITSFISIPSQTPADFQSKRGSHDIFLDVLVDTGILGFGSWIWLLATTLHTGLRAKAMALSRGDVHLVWQTRCLVTAICLNLLDGAVSGIMGLKYLWLAMGMIWLAYKLVRKPHHQPAIAGQTPWPYITAALGHEEVG